MPKSHSRLSNKRPKQKDQNPFLALETQSGSTPKAEHADLLAHTVAFLGIKNHSNNVNLRDKKKESLYYLLNFLESIASRGATSSNSIAFARNTAAMFVPWATSELLDAASSNKIPEELLWRTLSASLKSLTATTVQAGTSHMRFFKQKAISHFLTNKALLRLIPYASEMGLLDQSACGYATACYEIFLREDNIFPSLEVACRSLLPVIVNTIADSNHSSFRIIFTTMRFLEKSLKKANPKTAFQVLCTESSLLNWSRIYFYVDRVQDEQSNACKELMLKILWESFFNPDHHLDGFRSLAQLRPIPSLEHEDPSNGVKDESKKDSRFQCYQENLLNSLEESMLAPSLTNLKEPNQSVLLMPQLLPLLLEGYMKNLSVFESKHQKPIHKKKSLKSDPAFTQFFFFGTATALLWRRRSLSCRNHDRRTAKQCLQSISKCLSLLLQYDNFVASDDEKQVVRFNFLESLTMTVLETSSLETEGSEYTASIVEVLTRLDHRLVHDRLEQVLDFVVTIPIHSEQSRNSPSKARLCVITLFETYHQLRQFHHVLASILALVSTSHFHEKSAKGSRFCSILSDNRAKIAFADAVFDSPSVESKKMFESLNNWITNASASQDDNLQGSLEIAVQHLGVGLFKNVKVNKSTAPNVALICEFMMNNAVKILCNETEEQHAITRRMKYGVKLCAWIQHLQMKCSFWLGYQYIQQSETDASMPRSVRRLISDTACISITDKRMLPLLDDVVLLASFRLRKLDYLIHEQYLGESEELSSRRQYEVEARRLAGLMIQCAYVTDVQASIWQHVSLWGPYADEDHIQSFVMWMFSALAGPGSKTRGVKQKPLLNRTQSAGDSTDRAFSQALVNDASFLEIRELWDHTSVCALDTILLLVREATGIVPGKSPSACLINHPDWMRSSSEQFAGSLKRGDKILLSNEDEDFESRVSLLNGALRVAKVLNGLESHRSPSFSVKCADAASRLQSLCCRLHSQDTEVMVLVVDLVSTLRVVAAMHLTSAGKDALLNLLPTKGSAIRELLLTMKESSTCLLKLADSLEKGHTKKFLCATMELIKAISFCYSNGNSTRLYFDALLDFSKTAFATGKKPKEREMVALCVHGSAYMDVLAPLENTISGELLPIYFKWITAFSENSSAQSSMLLREEIRFFAGKCFRCAAKCFPGDTPPQLVKQMAQVVNVLWSVKSSLFNHGTVVEATSFMGLGYASTNPPVNDRLSLIDKLLSIDSGSQTWNVCVCQVVCGLVGKSLREAMLKVNQKIFEGWTGLQLFQLLIQELKSKGDEQMEIVSSFAERILRKSLDVLDASRDEDDHATKVALASSVIISLLKEKRLLTVKERHIAAILSQTTNVLQHAGKTKKVYSSCFDLVAALLQRFPNQICTCVPSLIAVLHAFQGQLLHNDELDNVIIRERSEQFTRLCELLLPNKEVFKKHILCLLLEFVHCLEHGMSLVRKECLLPSVFYLLDMLTKYEMQQLTTLMDTTSKALFRSVYQSYNKLHAYKGQ